MGMEHLMKDLLIEIGEDPSREGLQDTPARAQRSWQHLTSGYKQTLNDVVGTALFLVESNNMVVVQNIEYYSLCEHHLLPFHGFISIGYIPNGRVLGLSKLPRIVDLFSKRLQIQEQLTSQVAEAIMTITNAQGVGVVASGQHMCMMMRGIEKQHSSTTTSAMLGVFLDCSTTRQEFFSLLQMRL